MAKQRGFFSSHTKSSAVVTTIIVHIVLVAIAFSFVAVTVIQKNEVDFEVLDVERPKMPLKKLQVPVEMKKIKQQPKLRKQIVVKPNIKVTPDIKLPEIVGIKGGVGASGSSLGGGGSLGFSMPSIDFFGVKGKAEKVILILDADEAMSSDSLGGAYGFQVIKEECLKLIDGLPSTAVFNILVYDGGRTVQLFENLNPATNVNAQKANDWLLPLNQVIGAQTKYGLNTLGSGGSRVNGPFPYGKFKEELYEPRYWNSAVLQAMKQQPDTVFLLTSTWGSFMYFKEDLKEFNDKWFETSEGKFYLEKAEQGHKLLEEENKRRKAAGEPPRALSGSDRSVVRAYFPGTKEPPNPPHWDLGVKDFIETLKDAYQAYARAVPDLGIQRKNKPRFSLNVVYFKQEKFSSDSDMEYSARHEEQFEQLAESLNGELRTVEGLAAIKSYVDASELDE